MSIAFVLVNTELTSDMEIIGKIKDILTTEKDVEYEIQGVYGIYDIMLKISLVSLDLKINPQMFLRRV